MWKMALDHAWIACFVVCMHIHILGGGFKYLIYFFIFIPTWGDDPIWLIFFKWVETTNTYILIYGLTGVICTLLVGATKTSTFFPWQGPHLARYGFNCGSTLGMKDNATGADSGNPIHQVMIFWSHRISNGWNRFTLAGSTNMAGWNFCPGLKRCISCISY